MDPGYSQIAAQHGARMQSMLDPAGSASALIHELGVVLYIGAALVLVVVVALAWYGAYAAPRKVSERAWIVGGGIIFPTVVLAALLIYAIDVGNALSGPQARAPEIEVTGKLWWWEVRYHAPGRGNPVVLANELRIPVGRPVEIALRSDNVIHSFWLPALAGKVDMIPGRVNQLVLQAREPGIFRGQCAEFCGLQHAAMAFYVVAHAETVHAEWLTRQAADAVEPSDPFLQRGKNAFLREGCGGCHAIRGTTAGGVLGPDLTHVGSRLSIAAGTLNNHAGTLAGWIADNQRIKPGNLMPPSNALRGDELRAVAAYLDALK